MDWKKGVMIAAMLFAGLCCSATENVKKKKEKPQWEPRVAYRFHSISMQHKPDRIPVPPSEYPLQDERRTERLCTHDQCHSCN